MTFIFKLFSALLMIVAIVIIYFLPTIRAYNKQKTNRFPIFLLNLFLGWSLVGWVASLIWSFMPDGVIEVNVKRVSN